MLSERVQRERTGGEERTETTPRRRPRTDGQDGPSRVQALQETVGNRGVQELYRRGALGSPSAGSPSVDDPEREAAQPVEPGPSVAESGPTASGGTGDTTAGGGAASDGAADGGAATTAPEAETEALTAEEGGPETDESGGAPAAEAGAAEGEPVAGPPGDAADGPELLMPEPPEGLTDEDQARLESTRRAAGAAAAVTAESLPPAEENVTDAREAVTEPEAETQARAENELIETLGEQPEPSPEIEELCDRIYTIISEKRPADEESLVEADPQEMAQEAGGELDSSIRGDTERVRGEYDEIEDPPAGTPEQVGGKAPTQPDMPSTPDVDAASAVPEGVSREHVDLGPDTEAASQRIDEAGMNSEPAQLVESGPIAEARAARGELEATAEQSPEEVLAEQQAVLADAQADMVALQAAAVQALTGSREQTAGRAQSQQEGMVESEQRTREGISQQAQQIFTSAQERVLGLLGPLSETAMARWEAGVALLSTRFEQHLARVQAWIDERYSGTGGGVVELWDDLTGMPDWVTEEYERAEQAFGDGVCALIRTISVEVNGVVAACEAIIADARTRIDDLFSDLPEELQNWAAEQQAQFDERLDGLHEQAMETRDDFNRDLTRRAAGAVQEVREEVQALRQAARGLLGRIADAVDSFLEDPARFIINGLLELVGIAPASFWAVVDRIGNVVQSIADDPMTFANSLLSALGQGFQGFFDRVGDYLLDGLLDWLFSGLGSVSVEIPGDFSLGSVITFFLQLMGLTWDRIREVLARHIGEENVALIEQAYQIISDLIEMGPEGVYELIEEQLNPQTILDQVLDAAISYVTETLIAQVTARVVALFNPAGAIVQAVEAIYRVLSWVFENAARIFSLVETVVNGAADLVAGNTSGMATAVEGALGRLIAPVIDFLAGYAGLGDLPEKIADVIRGLQDWIMGIVDRVVGFIAGQARRLLSALGIGGVEDEEVIEEDDPEKAAEVRTGLATLHQEEQRRLENGGLSREEAEQVVDAVKQDHPVFTSLIVVDGGDHWNYEYTASPPQIVEGEDKEGNEGESPFSIGELVIVPFGGGREGAVVLSKAEEMAIEGQKEQFVQFRIDTGKKVGMKLFLPLKRVISREVENLDERARGDGRYGYDHIPDESYVGPGEHYRTTQKQKIITANMQKNNGVLCSDKSGRPLLPATQHKSGVAPDPDEVQIDHVFPREKGGYNSYANACVLSFKENRAKGSTIPEV